MENKTFKVEGSNFISKEQISELHEVQALCFFTTLKEKKNFQVLVSSSVGCDQYKDILERDFDIAYATAKQILRRVGEQVFKPTISNKTFTENLDGVYEE